MTSTESRRTHAKILKEARETTGAGNVQIIPKSPNDTLMSLDTTSEVEPEVSKDKVKYTFIPKTSEECTKEKIDEAGPSTAAKRFMPLFSYILR